MEIQLGRIRKCAGLSQSKMAEAVGVKVRTYGSWERGEVTMNATQLVDCARVLDCSTDEILGMPTNQYFADPREAELHAVWKGLSSKGKDHVLHHAKAEQALERGETESVERSNINTRRTA